MIKKLEALTFDPKRTSYHLFFSPDDFFTTCETLTNENLRGRPVVVGSLRVVCANLSAKEFGISSSMPTAVARSLCADLVVRNTNEEAYRNKAEQVFEVMGRFSASVRREVLSFFEGWFAFNVKDLCSEVTDHRKVTEAASNFARKVQTEIFERTGVTLSIGIGPNLRLAKLASQSLASNSVKVFTRVKDPTVKLLMSLDVQCVEGIGQKTGRILKGLGLLTVEDLKKNFHLIACIFPQDKLETILAESCFFISEEEEKKERTERKSVNDSQRFSATKNFSTIQKILERLSSSVCKKLPEDTFPRTISIRIKYEDLKIEKRNRTLKNGFGSENQVLEKFKLLIFEKMIYPIVKISVELTNFIKGKDLLKNSKNLSKIEQHFNPSEASIANSLSEKCPVCFQSYDFYGNRTMFQRHVNECLDKSETTNQRKPHQKVERDHHTHTLENLRFVTINEDTTDTMRTTPCENQSGEVHFQNMDKIPLEEKSNEKEDVNRNLMIGF